MLELVGNLIKMNNNLKKPQFHKHFIQNASKYLCISSYLNKKPFQEVESFAIERNTWRKKQPWFYQLEIFTAWILVAKEVCSFAEDKIWCAIEHSFPRITGKERCKRILEVCHSVLAALQWCVSVRRDEWSCPRKHGSGKGQVWTSAVPCFPWP